MTTSEGTLRSAGPIIRARDRLSGSPPTRHLVLAVAGLAAVVTVLETTSQFRNAQFATMAYFGIAIGGLTVLTGLNGQLSLGHGALMAIGAYATALLLADQQLPIVVILLIAALATTVSGAVIGLAAARLHGPYIAGATLALAIAVPGIALFFSDTLGGEQGLTVSIPDVPGWFADAVYFVSAKDVSYSKYVAYIGWITLILTFLGLANLMTSKVGRTWRAVRDDDVAAELAGINISRARVLAFVVSATCAGLAGAVMALAVRLTAPSGFTLVLSLALLTAVVIGGLGSLVGSLIGAAMLTFLPQLVTGIGRSAGLSDLRAAELTPLVYGLVLVFVILLAPAGIAGSLRNYRLRRKDRAVTTAESAKAVRTSSEHTPPATTN